MNRRSLSLVLLSAAVLGPGCATAADPTEAARTSASAWLARLDADDYSATWSTAAEVFKAAVSTQAWSQAAQAVRAPLGQLRTRTEKSATVTRTLPGAPDGLYVVFEFNTVFENKAQAVEMVTVKQESPATWKVAGYVI
ncbi:MAG: DUF4019 domain-containing protein, partial [Rubrivivax sp.]|nr:DUF4019 domain-containing protein [Rubrivivax sp.]